MNHANHQQLNPQVQHIVRHVKGSSTIQYAIISLSPSNHQSKQVGTVVLSIWPGILCDRKQGLRTPCKTPAALYWGIERLLVVSFRKNQKHVFFTSNIFASIDFFQILEAFTALSSSPAATKPLSHELDHFIIQIINYTAHDEHQISRFTTHIKISSFNVNKTQTQQIFSHESPFQVILS